MVGGGGLGGGWVSGWGWGWVRASLPSFFPASTISLTLAAERARRWAWNVPARPVPPPCISLTVAAERVRRYGNHAPLPVSAPPHICSPHICPPLPSISLSYLGCRAREEVRVYSVGRVDGSSEILIGLALHLALRGVGGGGERGMARRRECEGRVAFCTAWLGWRGLGA